MNSTAPETFKTETLNLEALKKLAKDLTREVPRSPRDTSVAGYVIAARMLDRCRAVLAGTEGDYWFNRLMDQRFFDFTKISADAFRDFVATGASDQDVSRWILDNAEPKTLAEIDAWNRGACDRKLADAPEAFQEYMKVYIATNLPPDSQVTYVFDIFDIEEGHSPAGQCTL